jgi:hypothetical protein
VHGSKAGFGKAVPDAVQPLLSRGVATGLAAAYSGPWIAGLKDVVRVAEVNQAPFGTP